MQLHELQYNLGHVLHQQEDLIGAAERYRQAIALQPDSASAYHNLGVVLDEQAQLATAIDCYRKAIALQPNYGKAYNNLGCALTKQGQLDEAIHAYQSAIALQPNWATPYSNLGQALQARGEAVEAIAAYRHAIHLEPESVLAHFNLGKVWQQQGQHAVAVMHFQTAIHLDPEHLVAYGDCGFSLLTLGQFEQAMTCFREAIARQPLFVEAYCVQTEALFERLSDQNNCEPDELTQARIACGRFLKALQNQLSYSQTVGQLLQTYVHLGNVLIHYGSEQNYQKAEVYYQKALQIQPDNIDVYLRLGNCLIQQQRTNAAILIYHLALTVHPHHPQVCFQLGNLLEQQPERAIAYYRQALAGKSEAADDVKGRSVQEFPGPPAKIGVAESEWRSLSNRNPAAQPLTCAGLNCTPCLRRIFSWFELVHLGKGVWTCSGRRELPLKTSPTFIKIISDGQAWAVPQQNDWMVCNAIAIFSPDHQLLPEISRAYPGQLPGCQADLTHPSHFVSNSPPKQIKGTVAVLSGLSGHVYFHWMTDILPRIEILRQHRVALTDVDWFWVNSDQRSFQQETLSALGIPPEKILASDRFSHIQAERLVVPSFPGPLGWMQTWAIAFLRQVFLPEGTLNGAEYPDRIYISRTNARYRRVLNEAAVIDLLEPFGFVSVSLESKSLEDQIKLFTHASVIIAPHGSGLTNLAFCRPKTRVIELFSPHYVRHYYWVISRSLALEHFFLLGEAFTCTPLRELMYQNPLTEDILVDLSSLQRLLTSTCLRT